MSTTEDLENWFTYHPPKADQQERYVELREHFHRTALAILTLTPVCADQTAALRVLREAAMAANQIIACNE
jgi:hypothetical protein